MMMRFHMHASFDLARHRTYADPWQARTRATARRLATTPLPWPKIGSERAALASRLQQLASQAKRVPGTELEARARIYGAPARKACTASTERRADVPAAIMACTARAE